jgi:phage FluMu gp28-like protein
MSNEEKQAWDRQPRETSRAYELFCVYRDLGSERSLTKTKTITKGSPSLRRLKALSTSWNWVERCKKYDDYLEYQDRLQQEKERREMHKRHAKIAVLGQNIVVREMESLLAKAQKDGRMTASDVARLMDVTVKVERLARGEPTDSHEVSGPGRGPVKLDLQETLKRIDETYGLKTEDTPANSRAPGGGPALPSPNFTLYPYQRRWIEDRSRLKIACKSRRIGYSFAVGLRALRSCLAWKHNVIILSKKEELAKEFISEAVAPHVRAFGILADHHQGYIPQTSIYKQEVGLSNGSRIIALTANPDSARSYEGDVVLDEFGFHLDARTVYEAIEPSITRGYSIEIISTPNGQVGEYYKLAKAAGLVDHLREPGCEWSAHRTDIYQALAQGCRDRYGKPLKLETVRTGCLDDEMWSQEYCCKFISIATQWISPELFEASVSSEAIAGHPAPESKELYAGWDVARSKDMSVIWLTETIGDVSWTRGVIELSGTPTPVQMDEARALMPQIRRMAIDRSSMGLTIFEQLDKEFPGKVEGVLFTRAIKEALAVRGKRRMEEKKVRLPDTDVIRNSFRSVKKMVTDTGQARFDAAHDERFGHADHWWAYCLAESAADQGGNIIHFSDIPQPTGRPIFDNFMNKVL